CDEPDHEQRVPGILAGDEAEQRQGGGERAEADDPQRRHLGHAVHHLAADDDPRKKCADREDQARGERDEVGAHARAQDAAAAHPASLNCSYQAIWIASSFGSFDFFGSSSKPSSASTRSRRSVKRSVSGSSPGNFSASASAMSSASIHFIA